jgi:hypothetical protein
MKVSLALLSIRRHSAHLKCSSAKREIGMPNCFCRRPSRRHLLGCTRHMDALKIVSCCPQPISSATTQPQDNLELLFETVSLAYTRRLGVSNKALRLVRNFRDICG